MDFRTCGMCFCAYSGCMLWEGGGGCGGGGAAGCVASAPNQSWLTSPLRVLQLHYRDLGSCLS